MFGNLKFGEGYFGEKMKTLKNPFIWAPIAFVILVLGMYVLANAASTSTKFSSTSIPEVSDAGTGWATNIRGWMLSVDENLDDLTPDDIVAKGP